MKKIFTLLFSLLTVTSFSQEYWDYSLNFEDTSQFFRIKIDTISNPNNVWQIGKPDKSVFTNAFSIPNVIVTDTIDAYPINDTSSFIIKHVTVGGFSCPHTVILSGKYQVNSDSLYDNGNIEFSPDNGTTWISLLTDTFYLNLWCYQWYTDKPVLTGNSNGWVDFYVNLANFGLIFNIQDFDTVLYRFTFISDSIQNFHDGLMYDELHFIDYCEGIEINSYSQMSTTFPIPSNDFITIKFVNPNNENYRLSIFDNQGHLSLNSNPSNNDFIRVDISDLVPGIYVYKLINQKTGQVIRGKIIKE